MEDMKKILTKMVKPNEAPGDYRRDDGILMCGKCHTPKQEDIPVDKSLNASGIWRVPVPCACRRKKLDVEKALYEKSKFEREMERLRKDGISDTKYYNYTFAGDDLANENFTRICKNYVEQWQEMKKNNLGILFSGTVGTGKTYLAACIANALIAQLVPVCVTSFPRILNQLQKMDDKQSILQKLNKYQLLVIDDLGTERDTTYSAEQIYNIIDSRLRSNKPVIITTNISIADMENTKDMQYHRIYDRVLEMCPIRLIMTGESRRKKNASEKRDKALSLLWGDNKCDT